MGEFVGPQSVFASIRTDNSPDSTANEKTCPLFFSTWSSHYTGYAIPVVYFYRYITVQYNSMYQHSDIIKTVHD